MSKLLRSAFALASLSTICSAQTITETFGSGANAFTMDFVTIGNPNNVADTTGAPNPAGSVAYTYNIGKYEVSRDMVLKASTLDLLGLTLEDMTYYGANGVNRPATGISWNEAARFVNWLNTSKGYQAAYLFDSSGNFQVWSAVRSSVNNLFRHKDARYFLPSVDEWYKAAYGNLDGTWNNYPTGSDNAPVAVAGGTNSGTAVYNQYSPSDISSAGGLSPYGTMAQGGNIHEWLESAYDGFNDNSTEPRGIRGGSWDIDSYIGSDLRNDNYGAFALDWTAADIGFRVAMIPEPSSLSLLVIGGVVVALRRQKRA
jgi:hypothetical protein